MKKKGRNFLVIAIVIVGGLLIFRLFFSEADSLDYKVFSAHSKEYPLHRLLGIVPSSYTNRFEISVTEKYDGKEILDVIDKVGANHPNFTLLRNDDRIEFLKAYQYMYSTGSEIKLDFVHHVSTLINLKVFNSYLTSHKLDRQAVIEKYCYFLSIRNSPNSFRILKSKEDIDVVLKEHRDMRNYLGAFPDKYNLITADDLDFARLDTDTIYCWFINKGVVKFDFNFDKLNLLDSVSSEIVGFLGVEAPTI